MLSETVHKTSAPPVPEINPANVSMCFGVCNCTPVRANFSLDVSMLAMGGKVSGLVQPDDLIEIKRLKKLEKFFHTTIL